MSKQPEDKTRPIADFDALRGVIDAVPHPIFLKDDQHRFVTLNQTMCDLMGHSFEELVGKQDHDFVPKEQADVFLVHDREVLETGAINENEEAFTGGDGAPRTIVTRKKRLVLAGGTRLIVGCITDITAFRRAEAQIRYNAEHDPLTGLANRAVLRAALLQAIDRAAAGRGGSALMIIDLDGFKAVNDVLGHAAGDNLLIQVSEKLSEVAGKDGVVARLGGDEFAVLQETSNQPAASAALASEIVAKLSLPFFIGARQAGVSASVGISLVTGAEDAETVMRRADLALYRAKQDGRNAWRHFEAEMEAAYLVNTFLQEELRSAIDKDQLSLVYQPYVRVRDRAVVGFEASPRWHHPDRGAIDAATIAPIADATGVSVQLNEWVLRKACGAAADWSDALGISVNVSGRGFALCDLPGIVGAAVKDSAIDPRRLCVEVGEATINHDLAGAGRTVAALRETGAKVALDHFGAGLASLQVLRSFPFDKVKLDGSLVRDVGTEPAAGAVFAAVLQLTRALELSVGVEGIDDEARMAVLDHKPCDEAQGEVFGAPRPISRYAHLTRSRPRVHALAG